MSRHTGNIELDRTVESIIVGNRHRTDLGNLTTLAESIARDGLLQPLTVTIDGVLVCGARRLAAIKLLGWRTVSVWVRSGISGRLGHLLAEQDDNMLHKDLTLVEAAALYRELKTLMAEDASRRQAATRFSTENQPGKDGAGKFPAPSEPVGRASEQAAAMIPGGASYKTLDKIDYLRQVADDPDLPATVRGDAAAELERIDAGAPVHPGFERVRAAVTEAASETADLEALAQQAVARAQAAQTKPAPVTSTGETEPARWPVRAFVATWSELADWWTHYDAEALANDLTDEQIASFLATADGTRTFADELRTARQALDSPRRHLRAL
ncbi:MULTISPECIES: ParB/RepB/Spo0J family partition protein [Micrococcales]|uniref:ParB/RepB/Spo0J family partition protein n=1 Tax=Micrococcales TaxID=85006 RepID=UPI0025E6F3D3|nr:ParB/RepB/Spo0J family partition protein [Microbacterium sp. UBA837]|tara:strand:- start:4074 stop:5054 length:981 start_codon:yes stop_codon:yes gene_type:complete